MLAYEIKLTSSMIRELKNLSPKRANAMSEILIRIAENLLKESI